MTPWRCGLAALALVLVAGCGADAADPAPAPDAAAPVSRGPSSPATDDGSGTATDDQPTDDEDEAHGSEPAPRSRPLRAGERRTTVRMPAAYTPSAPTGVGTDDYRCFLLDPRLRRDAWLTGTDVRPGNPDVVHHVILFRVPPEQVAEAERTDRATERPGWTCFGGTGLAGELTRLDDAPWLGAWAPGSREAVTRGGYGVDLPAGSRIVMQVHYNLLAGAEPDVSATRLRLMSRSADLTGLHTYLMPAPVELPCRPGRRASPLCEREAAVADVKARFGHGPGSTADLLHLLCGTTPRPGPTQSCTRTVGEPMTVLGVAGHMHLLGRSIEVVANPGTSRERTLLDVSVWDFDDQGSRPVRPLRLEPFDTLRVTCRHVQWLRDLLPAFEGQDERYVVWGEGTTDEMCLAMLQVARG